jgi:hypothetical protein
MVRRLLSAGLAMACGCAAPARYLLVADPTPATKVPDQREIWLAPAEAVGHTRLLGLATTSAVVEAAAANPPRDPLEAVLWPLLLGRHAEAEAALRAAWDGLPDYLRRLLAADLAVELAPPGEPATRAAALYQQAYDVQPSERSRGILKLRMRQLRYGR